MFCSAGESKGTSKGIKRGLLLVGGSLSFVLAIIGAILPVMPTTPFLLLSAYCYARSSRRCHGWLTGNRFFGRYVRHMAEGRKLSTPIKAALIASSGGTALLSAIFIAPNLTVRVVTLGIAASMSLYVVLQGRRRKSSAVAQLKPVAIASDARPHR